MENRMMNYLVQVIGSFFNRSMNIKGIIVDRLPRERTLYRKKSGTVADKQAIASYVDKAFIVQSLDDNFNVRR